MLEGLSILFNDFLFMYFIFSIHVKHARKRKLHYITENNLPNTDWLHWIYLSLSAPITPITAVSIYLYKPVRVCVRMSEGGFMHYYCYR